MKLRRIFRRLAPAAPLALACLALAISTAAAGPRLVIKLGQCCPPDQAYGVYAHGFADKIKEASGGEIVVESLDGGVMGDEQQMAQLVQLGTLQMGGITSNNVAQLAPSINVLVLPYMSASMEELLGEGGLLVPGPYLEELNRRVLAESGSLRILGGFTNAFRQLFVKDRCVTSMPELKGLKIRIPPNPVMEKMWTGWGAAVYPIAWSETFGAIAQGVVDAFDSPLDVILRMGFHEHIKYVTKTHFLPQAALFIVNEDWFQGLDPADRALIVEVAAMNDQWHYQFVKNDQKTLQETLERKHGVSFCDLSDEAAWKAKAQELWPELYQMVGGGKDWVDQTLAYKATGELH